MVNRIPLETVLLGSRRTPLHRTKALSSSQSTVAIRYSNPCSTIRAFSGQSSAPGRSGDFSGSPGSSKLSVARERTPNPNGPVRSPYTRISTCGGLKPSGVTLSERLTRKATATSSPLLEHRNFHSPWNHKLSNSEILCWQRVPFRLSRTHRLRP